MARFRFRLRLLPPALAICIALLAASPVTAPAAAEGSLRARNEPLLAELQTAHELSDAQLAAVRAIFDRSDILGQGNPAITRHPLTPAECRARVDAAGGVARPDPLGRCGAPHMAPLYDPATGNAAQAEVCIDQFEFPGIPCAYPVVWVRAREAAELCEAVGKRLCDAHEWEGACAGRLEAPDYRFDLSRGLAPAAAVARMAKSHNDARTRSWAYGATPRKGICAMASTKSEGCQGGEWRRCGSNTYPAGSFPECVSSLGVYDQHGNAAEHMNLPLDDGQLASRGSRQLGYTEMKGSWFIFDSYRAHEDDCRWRAPFWHGGKVMDPKSHQNYHLGFRCCKTLAPADGARVGSGAGANADAGTSARSGD